MAISIGQIRRRERGQPAIGHHHLAIDQYVGHFAAIGAAVHLDEAADGARYPAQEFETCDSCVARSGTDQYAARPAAAFEPVAA